MSLPTLELIDLLITTSQAGLSPSQGFELAAEAEASPWLAVWREHQSGVPLAQACYRLARAKGDQQLALLARALGLHQAYGGNLTELLRALAASLRQEAALRQELRARTAEGRFSAWVLALLSPLLTLYLALVDRSFLQPLVEAGVGRWGLLWAVLLWGLGVVAIRRAVRLRGL